MSRYIDAEAIKRELRVWATNLGNPKWFGKDEAEIVIDFAPSIDIVRCQDCKYWVYNFNGCSRNPCTEPWYATDFCNYGERKSDE